MKSKGSEKVMRKINESTTSLSITQNGGNMTCSEKLVAKLCKKTFLSLWSYPNPKRADTNKELCDLLVISNPYVIVFSVKEIIIRDSRNYEVDSKRWLNKAVEESCRQIYGAERALKRNVQILSKDKREIIELPKSKKIKIFRVAVAIGRGDRFPLSFGDFGKGFVHVFDETSLQIILRELDTITDFIDYLRKKELFYKSNTKTIMAGEENLLAVYLADGRQFPTNYTTVIIDGDTWNGFVKKKEYIRRKEEDKMSYIWDGIIEEFYDHFRKATLYYDVSLKDLEKGLRVMAKENRFSRRILGKAFLEFIGYYKKPTSRARILKALSNVVYVFLLSNHSKRNRELRRKELEMRCFVARGRYEESRIVVGIATEEYKEGAGHSYDLAYLEKPEWTDKHQQMMLKLQKDLGYFKHPQITKNDVDEFPKK